MVSFKVLDLRKRMNSSASLLGFLIQQPSPSVISYFVPTALVDAPIDLHMTVCTLRGFTGLIHATPRQTSRLYRKAI